MSKQTKGVEELDMRLPVNNNHGRSLTAAFIQKIIIKRMNILETCQYSDYNMRI